MLRCGGLGKGSSAMIRILIFLTIFLPATLVAETNTERACTKCKAYLTQCSNSFSSVCVYCRRLIKDCKTNVSNNLLPVRITDAKQTVECYTDRITWTVKDGGWNLAITCKTDWKLIR